MDTESEQSGTCLELALEGERLCKCGDFEGGVAFFEAAVKEGTDDMRTLSAIYSQLGNAYFYLGDYNKALHYHKLDLTIAKSMGDRVGEGKASGNLGNTLKMMGQFDEAITSCTTHLLISRELRDQVGEGRALYNLGNVYHTQGKQLAKLGLRDPGDFPEEVRECLQKGVHFYEQNLSLMTQMGDKSAQGRACGNLGNTHYLLGNFNEAVTYHLERLTIAREFGDKAAERRAQCNLGNANIFLGKFEEAVGNYKETLRLALELGDRLVEAQACYSLGNTFTLLRDYDQAVEYHLRHLRIAQELADRSGEGRAYWSLGNALTAAGKHKEALEYAMKHLKVSKDLGDKSGEASAHSSISDLKMLIERGPQPQPPSTQAQGAVGGFETPRPAPVQTTPKRNNKKRLSMDNMELLKMTPDLLHDEAASSNFHLNLLSENDKPNKETKKQAIPQDAPRLPPKKENVDADDDVPDFFDLLEKYQEERMNEQRCTFEPGDNKENKRPSAPGAQSKGARPRRTPGGNGGPLNRSISNPGYASAANPPPRQVSEARGRQGIALDQNESLSGLSIGVSASSSSSATTPDNCRDELFDLIAGMQEKRMDEQRACLPPMRRSHTTNGPESLPASESRGPTHAASSHPRTLQRMATQMGRDEPGKARQTRQMSLGASVPPDDDFFDMIMRCQGSRLEDQRSTLPTVGEDGSNSPPLKRGSQVLGMADATSSQGMSTVPDDDFFSLILRFQSGRIDDQRTTLPAGALSRVAQARTALPVDDPMRAGSTGSSLTGSRKGSSNEDNGSQSGRAPSKSRK